MRAPAFLRSGKLLPLANVLTAQFNMALITAGSFVVTPAVLDGLGDGMYGVWLLINSIISYMRMLDLGASTGTMKYGAGAYERGDAVDLARVFNTTSAVFMVVGGVAVAGTVGLAFGLPWLYPNILSAQEWTIFALGAAIALDLLCQTFAAGLRTRSFFFVTDSIEIVTYGIFKLGLVLYFAAHGLSCLLLAQITLAETVVRNAVMAGSALVWCPYARHLHPQRAELAMFKKIAVMAGAVSLTRVADILRFQLDAMVIGYFMPEQPRSIAIFGIGTRLVSIAYTAIGVIGAVMIPKFSGLSEKGDHKNVADLLRKTSFAMGLVTSFVFVNLIVLGGPFLMLWLRKPWIEQSNQLMLILLPGYYFSLLAGPGAGLLVGAGKLRGLTIITLAEGFANLVLSVILVGPFGLYGVAVGTLVPMVVVRAAFFPSVLSRAVGVSTREYWHMNARPMVIGVIYLVLVGGLAFIPLTGYARFVELGLASTLVYVVLLLVAVPDLHVAIQRRLKRSTVSSG